ncbi:MAG: class I SAM-dependent methyltransferase [Chloroflexi bacterium]|jgi:SAM-dependent methyltransferase|nr:class I SAM-dependent methyltransferase [Chloroflexota bacterium]
MSGLNGTNGQNATEETFWRGVDFSGVTVVLGIGTGRLIELLAQQAKAAQGHLVLLDFQPAHLQALLPLREQAPVLLVRGRYRQIPLLSETVDLLVVNGVLREVPESLLMRIFEEFWRVLVPGGQLRVSDIIEPAVVDHALAWGERNRIVRKLAELLQMPTALAVNLPEAAKAMRSVGFENPKATILPGYALTDAWLEETVNALRNMASRVADRAKRDELLERDIPRLIASYAQGNQRAAERFVLSGRKVGSLALEMEASFTEEDLHEQGD